MTTIRMGMIVPVIAWRPAARTATARTYSASVTPDAASAAVNSGLTTPPCTPTKIGVPTAPKVTAVLWIIMPNITAPAAGKPMATMRGAATAARRPESGCALDEGSKKPGDDDDLDPAVVTNVVEASSYGANTARALECVQEQNGPKDDQQQVEREEQPLDGGGGNVDKRHVPRHPGR